MSKIHRLLIFLALLPAAACSTDTHSIAVHISNGPAAYTQTFKITEGGQVDYIGPAKALNGAVEMLIAFNGLLTRDPDKPGLLNLQYQVELAGGKGKPGRSVQGTSQVAMRQGDQLTAIECGPWTVKLALDAKKKAGKNPGGAEWDPAGLPNYRLTANISAGSSRQECRLISMSGIQSSVADSIAQGDRKFGLMFVSLFAPEEDGRGFSLQYQANYGPAGAAKSFQLRNEKTLTLNKKTTFAGEGSEIELLLEGAAPAKQAAP